MPVLYPSHPPFAATKVVAIGKGAVIGLIVTVLIAVGIDVWRSGLFDLGGSDQDNALVGPTITIQPAGEDLAAPEGNSFIIPEFVHPLNLDERKPLTPAKTTTVEPPRFEFPNYDCGPPVEPGI
jgi:hypothetical protein